ncbi:MAG: glycosyltransferase family 4 protein [Cyanobacteriota bacterium]|nr:glycosyltransferase family 4 protein [Cyanobacteriota bacterium]
MNDRPLKLLFVSTSVGALGSGLGGGVELTLYNMAKSLIKQGHTLQTIAPEGSVLKGVDIVEIPGNLQITAQSQDRQTPIGLPENSVLENMWDRARQIQGDFDLIYNFAYDWLPLYLTPFFDRPVVHLVSMGSLNAAMDRIVTQTMARFPGRVSFYTHAQAATFGSVENYPCVGQGLDLSLYQFCAEPGPELGWVGRIAPEKGLEDAIAAVDKLGVPLKIWGKMQDESYWEEVRQAYPDAPVEYAGFLPTEKLQQELGRTRGLLMTPRWVEAFGNVAIEALACGVPVISYRRGGPTEIVRDGKTGWLVEPDRVEGLIEAIVRLPQIDRRACRQQAETEYSLFAMGERLEAWFHQVLSHYPDRIDPGT